MQKTFLKFLVFELVERMARFRLLLNECADLLYERAPGLQKRLLEEARVLEERVLSQKSALNRLFSESGNAKQTVSSPDALVIETYRRLCELSQILVRFKSFDVESEVFLFMKDALPEDLTKQAGEQSVFLTAEDEASLLKAPALSGVLPDMLVDTLSILQKNNPLAWVGLTQAYARHTVDTTSVLEALKLELLKADKKKGASAGLSHALTESVVDDLLRHALNLRLLGPAYYFQSLSSAMFEQDGDVFFQIMEPALFFGLNHQNVTHKSLVILHEACERSKPQAVDGLQPLSEEALASLYRAVEKVLPAKFAFQEKHMERAIQLQERLNQGTLLSSSALYPVDEVADTLQTTRARDDFSIYAPLSMMTETPHTPREIVNAGWLHKVERGPVWLYSALNEDQGQGFDRVLDVLNYQDGLLRKSIEVSEVHRVLLCSV